MKKRSNPLQVRIQARSVPKGMSPKQYLRALLRATSGAELPRGVEVELHWRNPKTKNGKTKIWRHEEFEDAIAGSSLGFVNVVRRAIMRRLGRV